MSCQLFIIQKPNKIRRVIISKGIQNKVIDDVSVPNRFPSLLPLIMLYQYCMILQQLNYLTYYEGRSAYLECIKMYYSFEIQHLILKNIQKQNISLKLNKENATFIANIYSKSKEYQMNIIQIQWLSDKDNLIETIIKFSWRF
ncbi:hypothetical protein pb186bvf_004554 [Paramecium bursaria]